MESHPQHTRNEGERDTEKNRHTHTHTLEQQVFMNIVHCAHTAGEDQHGRGCLLQTLEQIDNLSLRLDIFDLRESAGVRTVEMHATSQ